jgi:hypothetical protein
MQRGHEILGGVRIERRGSRKLCDTAAEKQHQLAQPLRTHRCADRSNPYAVDRA